MARFPSGGSSALPALRFPTMLSTAVLTCPRSGSLLPGFGGGRALPAVLALARPPGVLLLELVVLLAKC